MTYQRGEGAQWCRGSVKRCPAFCCRSLTTRTGEVVIDKISYVEDTKGNKGTTGTVGYVYVYMHRLISTLNEPIMNQMFDITIIVNYNYS